MNAIKQPSDRRLGLLDKLRACCYHTKKATGYYEELEKLLFCTPSKQSSEGVLKDFEYLNKCFGMELEHKRRVETIRKALTQLAALREGKDEQFCAPPIINPLNEQDIRQIVSSACYNYEGCERKTDLRTYVLNFLDGYFKEIEAAQTTEKEDE